MLQSLTERSELHETRQPPSAEIAIPRTTSVWPTREPTAAACARGSQRRRVASTAPVAMSPPSSFTYGATAPLKQPPVCADEQRPPLTASA